MATKFITHLTVVGERWDSLAWIYYGDATLFSPIIMANPSIPVESIFEAGLAIGNSCTASDTDCARQLAALEDVQLVGALFLNLFVPVFAH